MNIKIYAKSIFEQNIILPKLTKIKDNIKISIKII